MYYLKRLWLPLLAISLLTPAQDMKIREGVIQGVVLGEGGQPIRGAKVHAELKGVAMANRYRLAFDRNKWMGTSAAPNFRMLIPSSKEMEVKVSAPGYETWIYPDPAVTSPVLRMEPGSEIHLDIQLKRAHDKSLLISKFLIPKGYVGWLRVEHDVECASPIPVEDGMRIFRFTGAGVLETSSPMPQDAAERRYFYYADDGSERDLAADYRSGDGMIWQERPGSRAGKMSMFIFFVGTQEQFNTRPLPGFPPPSCQ